VYEKQEIVLECEFSRPNVEANWQKGSMEIKYSLEPERYAKKCEGGVYRLTIFEAKLEDAGAYSCTVKTTKTSCDVKVLELLAEVMKPLEDQTVVEKQRATFTCTLSKPRLKVAWFKGATKITENKDIQFVQEGKVYKLVISNAKLDDAGQYTVKYENECESTAELTVKGKIPNRK
jgi:titin